MALVHYFSLESPFSDILLLVCLYTYTCCDVLPRLPVLTTLRRLTCTWSMPASESTWRGVWPLWGRNSAKTVIFTVGTPLESCRYVWILINFSWIIRHGLLNQELYLCLAWASPTLAWQLPSLGSTAGGLAGKLLTSHTLTYAGCNGVCKLLLANDDGGMAIIFRKAL